MKSMTGYGYAEVNKNDYSCKVKIYSVNHRYFEINVKMPQDLLIVESKVKETLQKKITRGKISLFIDLENKKESNLYKIELDTIRNFYNIIKELNKEFNLDDNIKATDLLKLKDVLKYEKNTFEIEQVWPIIEECLVLAINMFEKTRGLEGEKLKEDVKNRIALLTSFNKDINNLREEAKKNCEEKLYRRLKELLPETPLNETIVKLEFAIFIDRSDITEEIVRIESHVSQVEQILEESSNKPSGKHLDFICQELNREFNTIGSKANFYKISDKVIQAKCELEKIREQLQNIE